MATVSTRGFAPLKESIRRHRIPSTMAAIGLGVAVGSAAAPAVGPVLVPIGVPFALAVTGVTMIRSSKGFADRERQAWRIFGAGFLIALVGVIAGGLLEMVKGEVPAFGWVDIFFIGSYVVVSAGIVRFPQMENARHHRVRLIIDGLVVALSLGAIMWVWFLNDLLIAMSDAPAQQRIIGMLYPIADVALLTVALILILRRSTHRFDIRLVPLALGFAIQTAADITFVTQGAGRNFSEVEPMWWAFAASTSMYLVSATLMNCSPSVKEFSDRNVRWLPMLAPYALAGGLTAMLVVNLVKGRHETEFVVLLAATLLVASGVIARQVVAIREARNHVENERRALISSISHELRTPLTAMVGFIDILAAEDATLDDAERREVLGVVQDQVGYMASIVSDMVLLARGRLGQMSITVSPVRVRDLLNKAVQTLDTPIDGLRISVDPDLHAALDSDRVQQVVVNYLTNALRYGGPTIRLHAMAKGSTLRIEVHDDGPGVAKRYELKMWDRFERGANRFNAVVPGSGIGLAIVKSIAGAHGGVASYQPSHELGGACFALDLPDRVAGAATRIARTSLPAPSRHARLVG